MANYICILQKRKRWFFVPTLNHVAVRLRGEWIPTIAEEISREYRLKGRSAKIESYMCQLCLQNVELKEGEKNVPYFAHKSKEADKTCPERTQSEATLVYDPSRPNLPIRIRLTAERAFFFEMGLLRLPEEFMRKITSGAVTIQAFDQSNRQIEPLSFSLGERLNQDGMTWLQIGEQLYFRYNIILPPELTFLRQYWPEEVKGIESGCLFDRRSGKKLPFAADVQVGKEYFLLSFGIVSIRESSLLLTQYSEYQQWRLYVVCAKENTKVAALFFLKYRCRLTDAPISVTPMWPVYIEKPYVLFHRNRKMWFHVCGKNVTTKSSPTAAQDGFPCEDGTVQVLQCTGSQQLLSAGRENSMLKFTYLWQDAMTKTEETPDPVVTDIQEQIVLPGESSKLPPSRTLWVTAPFDGCIALLRNGVLTEKRKLSSGKRVFVDHLTYGTKLCVYQGLDLVWTIRFEREKPDFSDDASLAKKLAQGCGQPCAVPNWGPSLFSLDGYPKVKRWFQKKRTEGSMPEDSYCTLRQFLINRSCKLQEKKKWII